MLTGGADPGPGSLSSPFVTLYAYDALGNLLRVDQKGSATNDSPQWRTRLFSYDLLSRLLTAYNPESGTICFGVWSNGQCVNGYDADGNLLYKTSPAPNQTGSATQTTSYCYDELNRSVAKGYSNPSPQQCTGNPPTLPNPAVTYTYDQGSNAIGHLSHVADQAGTGDYSYDPVGRIAAETRTIAGVSKSMSYGYNFDGSLKTLTYPSLATVTYTPDSAGRDVSAIDNGSGINYATAATYDATGALTGFVSGNGGSFGGITNTFSFNKRLQPVFMSAATPGQTLFSIGYDFHFGNGDNGNLYSLSNNRDHTRDQTFTYDALNRLTSAQNSGADCGQKTLNPNQTKFWGDKYGYDAWGNLFSKSVSKCSAENLSLTAAANNQL